LRKKKIGKVNGGFMDQESFNIALGLIKSGKRDEAKKILLNMLSLDSNNAIILEWIVYCSSNIKERINYLERIIQINPDNENANKLLLRYGGKNKSEKKNNKSFIDIKKDYSDKYTNTPTPIPFNTPAPIPFNTPPQKRRKTPVVLIVISSIIGFILIVILFQFYIKNISTSIPISNPKNYIVYEVSSTGTSSHPFVCIDVSYENISGSLNSISPCVGDDGPWYMDSNLDTWSPYRTSFSVDSGFFAYLSAQNEYARRITCNIYLADYQGANCLINGNQTCISSVLWQSSYCEGKYCICSVSGYK
jgi:tetratricopeptide (TPR) repeat protein